MLGSAIVGMPKPNQVYNLKCKKEDLDNCREFSGNKIHGKNSIRRHKSTIVFNIISIH